MIDKRRAVYLYAVGGVSVLLVLLSVTSASTELVPLALRQTLRRYFSLARENNLAVWWSGAVLAVAALHALDGRERLARAGDRNTAWAWAALALVLVALSLDEIGSLHERAELFVPLESWWALLPFAIVLLGLAGWSSVRLFMRHRPRSDVVLIAVSFACFASVALQEQLEHALDWPAWALPLRLGVEEGTELVGMTLLIIATSACSGSFFARRSEDASAPVFSAARALASAPFLAAAIVAVALFAVGTARLTDTNRGHPADWLAAMLFLLAAIAAWSSWLEGKRATRREIAVGGVCLWTSAATVQIGSEQITAFGTWVISDRLAALACALAALAVIAGTGTSSGRFARPSGLLALGAVALAAFAAGNPGRLVTYLASGYAAVLAYGFVVHRTAVRAARRLPIKEPV
jgi:hypothetical protein